MRDNQKVATFDLARGRWHEILIALGLPSNLFNGKHQPCPLCGGTDRFRYSQNDPTRSGGYYCSQCGSGNGLGLLQKFHGWDFRRAADEIDRVIGNLPPPTTEFYTTQAANPGACRRMYAASDPVADGDTVARYLFGRGLNGPWPKALRCIANIRHKLSGTVQHGMLAVFSRADGKPATIHRTFLNPNTATKADIDPVRMFMPGNVPAGGAIRLRDAAELMGIAEGVETALSAALLFDMPVWATTSANLLQQWQPPEIAKHITIFADNDLNYVGQCAAYTLAKRLIFEAQRDKIKRTVLVMVSPRAGTDWNDQLEVADAAQ